MNVEAGNEAIKVLRRRLNVKWGSEPAATELRTIEFSCNGCKNLDISINKHHGGTKVTIGCEAGYNPVEVTSRAPLGETPPCKIVG